MDDDDDDFLLEETVAPPKKKKAKKATAASFLDSILADDQGKAERRADHEATLPVMPSAGMQIDWAYINASKDVKPVQDDRRLSQESETEALKGSLDENFDEIVGCDLPRRVRVSSERAKKMLLEAREAVLQAADEDEVFGLVQRLVRDDDPDALLEALSQKYLVRLLEGSSEVDSRLVKLLHVTVACEARDELSEAAKWTLMALAGQSNKKNLATAETLFQILDAFSCDDEKEAAAEEEEAGGGIVRFGRWLECAAACVECVSELTREESLKLARCAACRVAPDTEISKVEAHAAAAARLARAATRCYSRDSKSLEDLWRGESLILIKEQTSGTFDGNYAAETLIALRTLPLDSTGLVRAATARAAKEVMIELIFAKTSIRQFYDELAVVACSSMVSEGLRWIVAAMETISMDVAGARDEPCLGSHERLYVALATLRVLYATLAPDLEQPHYALLSKHAHVVSRRNKQEMDSNAERNKELIYNWKEELKAAAEQTTKKKQATITSMFSTTPKVPAAAAAASSS